jgi:hypothetical protein
LRCLQDRIHEHAQEFLDLMASDDCIFYFCGLKRMYTSVLDMLEVSRVAMLCFPQPLDICAQVQHHWATLGELVAGLLLAMI